MCIMLHVQYAHKLHTYTYTPSGPPGNRPPPRAERLDASAGGHANSYLISPGEETRGAPQERAAIVGPILRPAILQYYTVS